MLAFVVFALPEVASAQFGAAAGWAGGQIADALLNLLWGLVVGIGAFFTGIGGLLLDAGINLFVIYFGQQYTDTGLGAIVDEVWVYIRDLFNLTFIFGLIYIGFKLILNTNDSNTKRWLAYLILAALLVNFSLFFTKFVIDLANLVGSALVTSGFEAQADPPDWLPDLIAGDGAEWYSVSGEFAQVMGLPSIYNPDLGSDDPGSELGLSYIIGSLILFLVSAVVFGAGGIMLIVRFIVLSVYMLVSPFMFIGWVFPQLSGITQSYWRGFLGQAFFAPAYLVGLYFSFRLLSGYQTEGTDLADAVAGAGDDLSAGVVTSLVFFIVVCGFLIASLIIAQKLSEQGANGTMGAVRATNRFARRTAAAPQRFAGAYTFRNTIGRGGQYIDQELERRGYSQYGMLGGVRQASQKAAGARYGGSFNFSQQQQASRAAAAQSEQFDREQSIARQSQTYAATRRRAARGQSSEAAVTRSRERLEQELKNANTEQVQQVLHGARNNPEEYRAIVGSLNATQVNALMKKEGEGALSADEKSRLSRIRARSIEENAARKGQARQDADDTSAGDPRTVLSEEKARDKGMQDVSDADIDALNTDQVVSNVGSLKQSQYDAVMKSENRTESEKARIREARENDLVSKFNTDPKDVIKGTPSDVAKLPKRILKEEKAVGRYSTAMLSSMRDLDEETRTAIRGNIEDAANDASNPNHSHAKTLLDWIKNTPRGREF
ncbi:MAG: hypothetical protein GVY22_17730 [Gammaproteobacteria bacterium]|nr:hypothetical protein [Gammaproteobacteria bacterium]